MSIHWSVRDLLQDQRLGEQGEQIRRADRLLRRRMERRQRLHPRLHDRRHDVEPRRRHPVLRKVEAGQLGHGNASFTRGAEPSRSPQTPPPMLRRPASPRSRSSRRPRARCTGASGSRAGPSTGSPVSRSNTLSHSAHVTCAERSSNVPSASAHPFPVQISANANRRRSSCATPTRPAGRSNARISPRGSPRGCPRGRAPAGSRPAHRQERALQHRRGAEHREEQQHRQHHPGDQQARPRARSRARAAGTSPR